MDSLTQIALGAATASVCVRPEHRRKAILIGACLGTLPDLDVFLDYGDAVSNFTYHRGFSHSLFVLAPLSILLWAALWRFYEPVRQSPRRWFLAIVLPLLTHPLLDAHTAYGTQLFWPLESPPVMWATIFIIDPLYTLPLIVALVITWVKSQHNGSPNWLVGALVFSSCYLVWTWVAQAHVLNQVKKVVQVKDDSEVFVSPGPLNTILWRVVVLQGDNYLEGYYSFLNSAPIQFDEHSKTNGVDAEIKTFPSMQRLEWFSHGFSKAEVIDGSVVISDLRMGTEGQYVFKHVIAEEEAGQLREVESTLLPGTIDPETFGMVWEKMVGSGPKLN